VLAALLKIVAQRFVQDWTIELADVSPLARVSVTFYTRLPTAMNKVKKDAVVFVCHS